jgi:hypothetical protein
MVNAYTSFGKRASSKELWSMYVKGRIEGFDDYYSTCRKKLDCDLNHVYQWFALFIFSIINLSKSYSGSINNLIEGGEKA